MNNLCTINSNLFILIRVQLPLSGPVIVIVPVVPRVLLIIVHVTGVDEIPRRVDAVGVVVVLVRLLALGPPEEVGGQKGVVGGGVGTLKNAHGFC